MDINLSAVKDFPSQGQHVDVTLGLGQLTLEVPTGTIVNIEARAGIGDVNVFGQSASELQLTQVSSPGGLASKAGKHPHLDIDAHVGFGYLQVTWG
jgi:hypothetical protein